MEEIRKFFKEIKDIDDLKEKLKKKGIIFNKNKKDGGLMILKYDKSNPLCNLGDEFTSYCRGMIIDLNDYHKYFSITIVCIPPEKAYKFSELIPINIEYNKLVFEEFYDGTMINVWYYNYINGAKWYISTRSRIGADCKWFSDKTFGELFYEALDTDKLDIELLDKNICHSFVLKHAENRIVKKYDKSGLILVQCRNIKTLELVDLETMRISYEEAGIKVNIPEKYNFKNMEDITDHMNKLTYESQGLVIKYNNNRTKIRNQNYNFVKHIRGNTPKLLPHYLDLRQKKLIKQYLYYYPEFKKDFDEFHLAIINMTDSLYNCYRGFHIYKKDTPKYVKLEDIQYELKPLVYELHGNYLNSGRKQKITYDYVKFYFNNLPIAKIIFVLNYKKNNEDKS